MTTNTYTPTTWVDEVPASSPLKYAITGDVEGEISASAQIDLATAITTPGTPLNATNLNHIEQGLETVQEQANDLEPVYARATIAEFNFSVPSDDPTKIPFDTATFDSHSCLTLGANARFTADRNGIYDVKAYLRFITATWNQSEIAYLSLYKNGTLYSFLGGWSNGADVSWLAQIWGADMIQLSAGDYIEIRAYQTRGLATLSGARMSVKLVSKL